MNSRNFQSALYVGLVFWALYMFNISCHPSSAQGGRDLASRQGGGKRVQDNLRERYRQLLQEMKSKGYDVSEASALNEKAKRAAREGNRQEARQLLEQAIAKLESAEAGTPRVVQVPSDNRETGKTVQVELPVTSKVRVVETFPWDTNSVTSNTLQNFHYFELEPKDGAVVLNIDFPVIVEEYPYSDFKFQKNKAFGSTESGQVNIALPDLADDTLNPRQRTILSMLSQSGIGLARDFKSYDSVWSEIEPRKGAYDFSRLDFLVSAAENEGIDCIGRITPHRERRKGGLPEDEAAYVAYIKQIVGRYKGRVKYWQTLKEPEPRMRRQFGGNDGGLSPEDAVRILELSYNAIKSVDKNAIVYFPGTGPHFEVGEYNTDSYFEKIISLGGASYFDVLGFDAYVYDIEGQATKYRDILKKHGLDKPLWVAQTGVPDCEVSLPIPFQGGGSPRAQCAYMVKAYAIAFAAGIEKVFWGEFLDESRAEAKNRNKGSILWEGTGLFYTGSWIRKPGYFTHRLLATALGDFTKAEKVAPNIVKFTFAGKSPVYVVWPK